MAGARIGASVKMEAVAWLYVFPMSALCLKIDDRVIWVATGFALVCRCAALIPANIVWLWSGSARHTTGRGQSCFIFNLTKVNTVVWIVQHILKA